MKKIGKMKKYLILLFAILALFIIFTTTSKAANASITCSSYNVEPNTPVTISVNGTGVQWNLKLYVNGTEKANSSELENYESNKSISFSTTYTPESEGTVTVELKGSVTDYDESTVTSFATRTITVKAKEQQKPADNNEQQAENNEQQAGNNEQQAGNSEQQAGNNEQAGNNGQQQEEQKPVEKVPNFTNVNKTVYTTSGIGIVNLRSSWSTSSNAVPVSNGTELTLTGTSTEEINDHIWYRVSYKNETKYIDKNLITETKPEEKKTEEQKEEEKKTEEKQEEPKKSSNTNLKELKVNVEGLTPAFDAKVKEYTLNVKADVEKIEVTAATEDEKATYVVSGNEELKTGENSILVTVTAEDGTKTIYQIKVTKAAPEGLKLTKLKIEGYELSPKFDSDVFDYKLNVVAVDKLNIVAEASEEKAIIEIVGNAEFQNGENLVTIMAKSEDGSKTVTYQITINKKEAVVTPTKTSNDIGFDKIIIAVAILIVIVVLSIIAYLLKNKKKNNNLSSDNYYNGTYDDNDDNYDTIQNFEEDESYEDYYDNDEDNNSNNGKGKHF